MQDLEQGNVQTKFTNPLGPLLVNILARNHKKLMVIDDKITYIGGINFSEHNFDWHDMMIRFEDKAIANFFKTDFLDTWSGKDRTGVYNFELADFCIFDGKNNQLVWERVFELINKAESEKISFKNSFTIGSIFKLHL